MEDPQKHQKNWTVEIKWVLKYLRWCKIFNYPHFCQETRSQKSFSCYGMGAWKSLEIKKLIDFLTNQSINQLEEKKDGLRSSHPCTKLKMWQHTCMPYTFMFQSFWSCVKLWHILISRAWRNIMLWLPKITLDLLTTEELLLYDNFKRNVEFNFWKQLGMKGWNRDTIVVTVLVQVTKQCKHCNNQTCCSHLIKWDSKWVPKCCTRSSQSYLDNI